MEASPLRERISLQKIKITVDLLSYVYCDTTLTRSQLMTDYDNVSAKIVVDDVVNLMRAEKIKRNEAGHRHFYKQL